MLSLIKTEESRSRPDLNPCHTTKSHLQDIAQIIQKERGRKWSFRMKNKATLL